MLTTVHNSDMMPAYTSRYYEYLLKAWITLDDKLYLDMFNEHYAGIMTWIKQGPFLVTTPMSHPGSLARKFMDSLQMFWPVTTLSPHLPLSSTFVFVWFSLEDTDRPVMVIGAPDQCPLESAASYLVYLINADVHIPH